MGLFNKGNCPICNSDTSMLTKSSQKYNNDYICQDCLKKLLNSKIFITKIKNMSIDELKEIVKNHTNENKSNTIKTYQIGKKVKQVIVLNTVNDSKKRFGSSVVRGAVGNFALGPIGAIGGAISGKNKITSKTTFLIEYTNGDKVTKTVDNNSKEYKELCKYIKF